MKVSLIATVLNEEDAAAALVDSALAQTRRPDEVVIVDGGSTDRTMEVLLSYGNRLPLKVLAEPGCSISRGRNLAIAAASGEVIAATDAGVRLHPRWLEELLKPFGDQSPPAPAVSCGFFQAAPHSVFEVALGAATLPDIGEINPATFLPSSRSVAFTQEAWEKVGGYPEWLDYCEDLVFDLKLRRAGYRFVWAPSALAYFRPRPSLGAFFRQYYRYARGDGKADLWFRRHVIRYLSYAAGAGLLIAGFTTWPLWLALLAGAGAHLSRPYRRLPGRVRNLGAWEKIKAALYIPLVVVTGDVSKMLGYPVGVGWRQGKRRGYTDVS
ncbi:MAG: glycosyltransferase [Chloroflexi bacterium]|nr:glycosyltransferase [Chloroflexota bacterium]